MAQRGRPRYPDVLTPRQWEVLALLREGLTNEQIALRLGISLDGVKFHVSEILGKLGVTSRNEAARWEREERAAPSAALWHGRGSGRSRRVRRHRGHRRAATRGGPYRRRLFACRYSGARRAVAA
jgi:DNA-binding CsgD family transcriptional regulator